MKYFHYTEGEKIRTYELKGPDISEPVFWHDDNYGVHIDIITPDNWEVGTVKDFLLKEGFFTCHYCGYEAVQKLDDKFVCDDPECDEDRPNNIEAV